MKPLKVRRSPDVNRMCRLCARPYPETAFPPAGWTCEACSTGGVRAVIPLKKVGEGWRYDTAALFAGYRVFKVPKGERAEYETEVRSPMGEIYPVAGAAVALLTHSTQMANKLAREFKTARIVTTGDDGRCCVHFPAELFPALARRLGVFKPRTVTPAMREHLAAAREKAREKAAPPAAPPVREAFEGPARQMGLDF